MDTNLNSSQTAEGKNFVNRLVEASIVTSDDAGDDLTLTDDFRTVWQRRMEHVRKRDSIELLALLFDTDPDGLTFGDGDGVAVVRSGRTVGEWPSEAALIADVAAFVALSEQLPAWEELDGTTRDELIARLRVFLESCPSCRGEIEGTQEATPDEAGGLELSCVECGAALL